MHRTDEVPDGTPADAGTPPAALQGILRFIARHVPGLRAAVAAYFAIGIAAGMLAAVALTAFVRATVASHAQRVDESVLHWVAGRRTPSLDYLMLQLTTLGDGIVIVMLTVVASALLWLTRHRWSVYILLVAVLGGKLLNTLLKQLFARERPSVVEWVDQVSSPSFPSGHAMSAMIAYGSIALLVSRLEPTATMRRATWLVAALLILGIGGSRVYLGVHYPTDVLTGFAAGLAWLAFIASSVSAVRYFRQRTRPESTIPAPRPATQLSAHDDDESAGTARPGAARERVDRAE